MSLSSSSVQSAAIVTGPDDNLWFTEIANNKIGVLTGVLATGQNQNSNSTSGINSLASGNGSGPTAPETGFGAPGGDPLVGLLAAASLLSVAVGIAIVYKHQNSRSLKTAAQKIQH